MITPLIDMQGLPDCGHMTISTIYSESHDKRPGVAIFADITIIATFFIKTIFIDSRKVKRIRSFVSKCNLYMYFLI